MHLVVCFLLTNPWSPLELSLPLTVPTGLLIRVLRDEIAAYCWRFGSSMG